MIPSSVEFSPRYAYFKWDGRVFNFNSNGFSIDGIDLLGPSPNSSNGFFKNIGGLAFR